MDGFSLKFPVKGLVSVKTERLGVGEDSPELIKLMGFALISIIPGQS